MFPVFLSHAFRVRCAKRPNSISRVFSDGSPARTCQPLPKLSQKPFGVFAMLKSDDEIVSVADNYHLSPRGLPSPCLNPQVEHIVQVHVSQKR